MSDSVRCPVCGNPVGPGSTLTQVYEGETYLFDAVPCLATFQQEPQSYVPASEESADDDELGPHMGSVRPGA